MRRLTKVQLLGCAMLSIAAAGCGKPGPIFAAKSGDYHEISPADWGVYLTIKIHATNGMAAFFHACKSDGKSDKICGRDTLRVARGVLEKQLHGAAWELWNGDYSIFGYHPHLGKSFDDDQASDLATAVYDLAKRDHECLRVHWKPSGINWTTANDEGIAECSPGKELG